MTDRPKPDQRPKPVAEVDAKPGKAAPAGDTAFDLWLNRGLHQLFDDVANEPVPEELLRLIQEDRKK